MLLLALLDVSVSAYGGGLGELRLDGLDLGLVLCIGLHDLGAVFGELIDGAGALGSFE